MFGAADWKVKASSGDRPTRAASLGSLSDASSVVTPAHSTLEIGTKVGGKSP